MVSIHRLPIRDFITLSENQVILDVRSPGEYYHAHIPGARSFPLFTDEERKIVGTAYKQQSRELAIRIGLDFFGPKMRPMVEEAEKIISSVNPNTKEVFVYCWRGGMRSAGVAWLLDLYGFKVHTLAGGYKTFRTLVLETFTLPFRFKILGGYTGSGKTIVLQQIEKLEGNVIDLEKIASHKGSAFGSHGMPTQPKQEMFENLLAAAFWKKAGMPGTGIESELPLIWLEDESQRIGNLNIPGALWETMRNSPVVFLDIPFEERLKHIIHEYGDCDPEKLIGSVDRISKRLGHLEARNTKEFIETGKIAEAFCILLQYYDKRYVKSLHNREGVSSLLTKIHFETVSVDNALRLIKYQPA